MPSLARMMHAKPFQASPQQRAAQGPAITERLPLANALRKGSDHVVSLSCLFKQASDMQDLGEQTTSSRGLLKNIAMLQQEQELADIQVHRRELLAASVLSSLAFESLHARPAPAVQGLTAGRIPGAL